MPGNDPPAPGQARAGQITAALWLVWISVGFGAASSLLALTALALYRTLGWWWPDPAAALIVAAIAAAEAWHTAPRALLHP